MRRQAAVATGFETLQSTCTSVVVASHANGIPSPANFTAVQHAMPALPTVGVLVALAYASVDPGMRGWVSVERNYMTVPVATVMRAPGVGEVIASDHPDYRVGDVVYGMFGWTSHFAAQARDIYWTIDRALAPLPAWLGALGINGITAWIGYRHFGRPRPGNTLLVTTAAGSVGSVVGQLAAADGIRCVGLAGGADKADLAIAAFGYHQAIDYRGTPDLDAALRRACPDGIDIFYDNVAGTQADAAFALLKPGAGVVQCGSAAIASWVPWPQGPRRERDMIVKRLSWHGFVVTDHADLFPAAREELQRLYLAGHLAAHEHVLDGLEAAPGAIEYLYSGRNLGKLCIRIAG
jgi:NADPH-dependent curcumin reductase CurA